MSMNTLYTNLKKYGKVKSNALLSKCTTFRIGGPAKFLVEVLENTKLVELLNFLSAEEQDFFILGGGSNLLLSDEGFDGVAVKIKCSNIEVVDKMIICDAGVSLGVAVNTATQNSLTGLEWGAGIPGTIGGAVRGNAGAMGKDMSRNVSKVEVWENGEVKEMDNAECEFSYRDSGFKNNNAVILRVWLKLAKGDPKEILSQVQLYLGQRSGKFPPYPSAGCFFKNLKLEKWPNHPKDLPPLFIERGAVPAGWLIEQAGVKGLEKGGAAISDKHCNFIVNKNEASQSDVLAIVEEVQTRVYNKFKVEVELEVEIVR